MTGWAILIPAAGAARRMRGRDKLLEEVDGQPLLRRQAAMAAATGAPVLVTLGPDHAARRAALAGMAGMAGIVLKEVPGAAEGLAASIRAGAAWAERTGAAALMVLLADLPELETADLLALSTAFAGDPARIWRATDAAGRPGHPVIVPARLFKRLKTLTGDAGARDILAGEDAASLPLPGRRATTDLDTPEDWARWRADRPNADNPG